MSLWGRIESDVTDVLFNATDGLTCTAIQLPTGGSFTGILIEENSNDDKAFGIANIVKSKLWLPIAAKPKLQEKWLIQRPDGSQTEFTTTSFGARSGGLLCVEVEQVTVSKFAGSLR